MLRVKNTLLLLSVVLAICFIAVCALPLSDAVNSSVLTGIEAVAAGVLLCGALCSRINESSGNDTDDTPDTDGSDTGAKTVTEADTPDESSLSKTVKNIRTTENMRDLRVHVSDIAAHCDNPELNKKIQSLAENFQYSDPVSNESLFKIESEMEEELVVLEILISSDSDKAIQQIEKIDRMLAQRNQMCRLTK